MEKDKLNELFLTKQESGIYETLLKEMKDLNKRLNEKQEKINLLLKERMKFERVFELKFNKINKRLDRLERLAS